MKHFCPKCYSNGMRTVEIKDSGGGNYVCTQNSNHKFTIGAEGFPKSKKL